MLRVHFLALFVFAKTATASVDDFLGEWYIRADAIGRASLNEIRYPVHLIISREGNHLKGVYTDQRGYRSQMELIATINEDRDLIFVHSGGTKEDVYSPVHHAKIVNGQLRGVCFNQSKQFEWLGTRAKP